MARGNQLVVEVVGDTTKLEAAMKRTEQATQRLGNRVAAVGAGFVAGQFLRNATRDMAQLGGEVGRAGDAVNALLSLDAAGFFRGLSREVSTSAAELAKVNDPVRLLKVSAEAAAGGFDKLAASAKAAAQQVIAARGAFVDPTKIRDPLSPGSIASQFSGVPLPKTVAPPKQAPGRRGITAQQRNEFFDALIGRKIDRVQDIQALRGQVQAFKEIEGLIQQRINITKDITRKLNLEDELVRVRRQRKSVMAEISDAEAEAAKKARDKANAQKKALLDAAANIKAGMLAYIKAIKGMDQQAGQLTKTTSLNTGRILSGLGLSRDEERSLRARLSHFNSAGVALAGARTATTASGDLNLSISIDGRQVEHSVTKNQQKRARANPPRRRGS